MIEEARTEALIRTCNKCKVRILKDDGCNKVVCTSCRAVLCDVCGEDITKAMYNHFDSKSARVPPGLITQAGGKCPLYDTSRSRKDQQVDAAEKEARSKVRAEHPELSEEDLEIKFAEDIRETSNNRQRHHDHFDDWNLIPPPAPLPRHYRPPMPPGFGPADFGRGPDVLMPPMPPMPGGFPMANPEQLDGQQQSLRARMQAVQQQARQMQAQQMQQQAWMVQQQAEMQRLRGFRDQENRVAQQFFNEQRDQQGNHNADQWRIQRQADLQELQNQQQRQASEYMDANRARIQELQNRQQQQMNAHLAAARAQVAAERAGLMESLRNEPGGPAHVPQLPPRRRNAIDGTLLGNHYPRA